MERNQTLVYNKNNKTYYIMNGRGYIPETEAKKILPTLIRIKDTPVYTSYRA